MSHLTEELVLERLKAVKFPGYSRDIVSFGLVKEIKIAGSDLLVRLSVATSNPAVAQTLKKESEQALGRSRRGQIDQSRDRHHEPS